MAVDKCLTEVKRVVQDLLTDDEINEVLTKVKSNLAIARAAKEVDINDSKIAQKVIDEVELEQAQNKARLANDTIKSIEEANNIIENFSSDPVKGIRALTVGIEDFGVGSRRSVGNEQTALEEVYMKNFFTDLQRANVVDVFSEGKMDLEIYRELSGLNTGVKEAKAVADIIKKHNEILRTQLNNLGANIGKLDDWIIRQYHDPDKMIGAA